MKLLVIVQYWYPHEGPCQPIYGAFFDDLMSNGHELTILTALPFYRKGFEPLNRTPRGKLYVKESWHGATVYRTFVLAPRYRSERLTVPMRALNFLSFFVSSLPLGLFLARHDLIIAFSFPPLLGGLSARLISAIKRTPYIYCVKDIFPEIAIKSGVLHNGRITALLQKVATYLYSCASLIQVNSEGMKQVLLDYGVPQSKIRVIPDFCDTVLVQPTAKDNNFSREHGLVDKFVVLYAGNIGLVHDSETVIKAAALVQSNSDILFVFVGRGEKKQVLEQLSQEHSLQNVMFLAWQPYTEMPSVWASADVGLVTLIQGAGPYCVPSKTFGIMASGRPVLAMVDRNSEIWEIVERADAGKCITPGNFEMLAQEILRLYQNKAKLQRKGAKARSYVVQNFNGTTISAQFQAMVRDGLRALQ